LPEYVHCHECPLQSICSFGCPSVSKRWHEAEAAYEKEQEDSKILMQSTNGCPLRKLAGKHDVACVGYPVSPEQWSRIYDEDTEKE